MRHLLAHIAEPAETADRRRMQRRILRLDVAARTATVESAVVIHDLSRTGLLIETDADFEIGETFVLILPEIDAAPARIVRVNGKRYGCEFLSPVPASAVSAALLKTPCDTDDGTMPRPTYAQSADGLYAPPPARALPFKAVTALFTAAILLVILALASLTFS